MQTFMIILQFGIAMNYLCVEGEKEKEREERRRVGECQRQRRKDMH